MNGGAVTLDTVMIKIESDAGKAASNVAKLAEHLGTLRNNVKGGFKNIEKLSEALNRLTPALKKLASASKNLQAINDITSSMSQLKSIDKPTGLISAISSLEKLPGVMRKMDGGAFTNLKRVSEELAQSLTPLSEKMQSIADGYSAFSKIQNTFGKSASTVTRYAKQQQNIFKSLASTIGKGVKAVRNFAQGVASGFGKNAQANLKSFYSKFKQVYLSLLGTRTLFTLIRKGASEYMNFDQTLQKFATNIWRAFGAQLAPAIEYAMELFKQFVRVVYSVVYAITGIDLIAKANEKAMAGWGKAAKDTLGNLQKFDDLNVVEFPKGSGDENELIEMDKIDLSPIQKVIDWVRKLKEEIQAALDTGEWYTVGKVFATGIGEGIDYVIAKIPDIRNKLFEIARDFGDFLNGAIANTNWDGIGTLITNSLTIIPDTLSELIGRVEWENLGKGLGETLKTFEPDKIISSFMGTVGSIALALSDVFINIPWGLVGEKFGDAISSTLSNISSILDKIPWYQIGQKVRDAIEGVNWKEVWDGIVNVAKESFQGLNEFLSGLTGLNVGVFETLEKSLVGIGAALGTYKIVQSIGGIFSAIGGAVDTVVKAAGAMGSFGQALGLLSKGTLSIGTISGITGVSQTLLSVITPLVDGLTALGGIFGGGLATGAAIVVAAIVVLAESFRQLWNESETFKNSVKEIGTMIADTFLSTIDTLWQAIQQGMETLKSFYDKAIKPLFDLLVDIGKPILEMVVGVLNILYKNVIQPFAKFLQQTFLVVWDVVLIAVEALGLVLQPVINVLQWLWDKVLSPIVDFLMDKFLKAFDKVTSQFKNFAHNVTSIFGSIRKFLDDMLEAMRGGWKSFANFLIEKLEWLINKIIGGLNWLIKQVNKVGFDVPDWVPGIGGQRWGFNIKQISEVSLPRLETGTNEIPYEGIYHLHPGEAVVPKKYNPALGNGGSEEMAAKMDTLIDIMNNMNFTNIVNVGNKKLYEGQQAFNRTQQNKYGTINLY